MTGAQSKLTLKKRRYIKAMAVKAQDAKSSTLVGAPIVRY